MFTGEVPWGCTIPTPHLTLVRLFLALKLMNLPPPPIPAFPSQDTIVQKVGNTYSSYSEMKVAADIVIHTKLNAACASPPEMVEEPTIQH